MSEFKCEKCGQTFTRLESLKRHSESSSSACVMKQALQVVKNAPTTTLTVTPPLHHHSGGVVSQIGTPQGILPYIPPTPQPLPSIQVNWKKVGIYCVVGVFALVVLDSLMRRNNQQSSGTGGSADMGGFMKGAIPVGLMGIMGIIFVSKALRGELSGWTKVLNDLAK